MDPHDMPGSSWPPPIPGPSDDRETHLRAASGPGDPEWTRFLADVAASDPDHPDLPALRTAFSPPHGATDRLVLAKRVRSASPEAAALLRTSHDLDRRSLRASVALVALAPGPEGPDHEGLLAEALAGLLRSALAAWEGRLAPGTGVAVQIGPGPGPDRTGVAALAVADALELPPPPGGTAPRIRPAVDLRDAEGRPARLPEPARIAPPPGRRECWDRLMREVDALLFSTATRVTLRMPEGSVEALDESEQPVDGAEVWLASSGEARETLGEILACAELGRDAALCVSWEYRAVLSAQALEDGEWTESFEALLVDLDPPGRADRRRDVRRFWAAFPYELASVMAARRDAPPAPAHPGSPTPN